nr:hypothetical protein 28 [Balneolaceae bacterium]
MAERPMKELKVITKKVYPNKLAKWLGFPYRVEVEVRINLADEPNHYRVMQDKLRPGDALALYFYAKDANFSLNDMDVVEVVEE